jgi:hypothetical protein
VATTLRMPVREPVIDENGIVQRAWRLFFRTQNDTLSYASVNAGSVSKTVQQASIAATPVPMTVSAGFYRVSVYARRTQAATTSSDLKVDIGFTESGASLTVTTGTDSTNTTSKVVTGNWVLRVDQTTTITYATTYASVGATPMQYRLDVVVEQVQV